MQTIGDLLRDLPFFAGFDERYGQLLAGCAVNIHVVPGDYLCREGDPAERFYVIRHGRVAVEAISPTRGPLIVDTADDDDVIGWEWLVPPYRTVFDLLAVEHTSAIAFDGACLRGKCAEDHDLGYVFLQQVAQVMFHQLASARVRLLDLYGTPRGDR